MRISDWSSDVCSSDLRFRFLSQIGRINQADIEIKQNRIRQHLQRMFPRIKPTRIKPKQPAVLKVPEVMFERNQIFIFKLNTIPVLILKINLISNHRPFQLYFTRKITILNGTK